METAESLGFIQYWGASKWLNLARDRSGPLNILVSGGCDMRHVFKTCLDAAPNTQLTFYIHEKHKEPFCRQLLLMLILHTTNLAYRERTDLFLDVFGNTLVRDKTQAYIDKVVPYIDSLISDEKKYVSALNKLVDLRELKFKDRDEIVDVVRSWYSSIPFQMDKLRDQRLRYHYKTRYDFRSNLIDWDYQMNLKEYAPIVHYYHYREWRQTGVAFESRFSTYPTPNRTLSSYLPGKKKNTHESCLVRGYWGDIILSPYFSYGISTDVHPEKEKLFKVVNMAQSSHAVTVSEFNVQYMIQKLDNLSEYHIDFEGENQQQKEPPKKEEQLEKIEEQEEKDDEETKETQANTSQSEISAGNSQPDQLNEDQKLKQSEGVQSLNENIQDFQIPTSKQDQLGQVDQEHYQISNDPLLVLNQLGVRIVPIFDEIDKIIKRSKFKDFFDVGYVGFYHSAFITKPDLKNIFKSQALVYIEDARFLVPLKKDERQVAFDNLVKIGGDNGWKIQESDPNNDHIVYQKL